MAGDRDQVHVWRADLRRASAGCPAPETFLDADERRRAARFRFAADRRRYEAAHFALRDILSRYLGAAPGDVAIGRTARGQPHLAGSLRLSGVRFSASRSRGLALIAVAWHRAVGIDVEYLAPDEANLSLADRQFTRAEAAILRSLPPEQRHEAFYRLWVRKEAYLKAVGQGLGIPLDQLDVPVDVMEGAGTTTPGASGRWGFHSIDAGGRYAAALVSEGRAATVRCLQWC